MNQDALFSDGETTPAPVDPMPDPNKYQADRVDCLHVELHPSTAYSYGCRCRGCYKYHSAVAHRRKTGPLPCAFPGCSNMRRRAQRARYCDDHATCVDYEVRPKVVVPVECAVCLETKPINSKNVYRICPSCHELNGKLINQAIRHRVDIETLVQWISDPSCRLCGQRFYIGRGGSKSAFAIDHDHGCCGGRSCGSCIRGILCMGCNMSLGHVEAMINRSGLPTLLDYIGFL
jgi:hypothetical protein